MNISELRNIVPNIEIISECEFDALGMATTSFSNEKVLSFLADEKFLQAIIDNNNITSIITTKKIYQNNSILNSMGVILTENPKRTFYEIHNELCERGFYWEKFDNEIATTAVISKGAFVEDNSIIIGENSIIEPGVVIHSGTVIGDDVIIRSGSNIGTNGFQFLNDGEKVISVKTGGRTVIKNNVEIQHNCCVDRGVFGGDTILSDYVKIDNLVHVAHDNIIGERTIVTAGVTFGGRVVLGNDCWLGLNAIISNGITIGDNCKVSLGAVVTRNVPSNSTVSGNFAIDHKKFIEFIKTIR